MSETLKKLWASYRLPLLLLLFGLGLLLWPAGKTETAPQTEEERLEALLSAVEGVGRCRCLLSENGVVVACDGAEDPAVRWEIVRAVGSYTGFSSDRVTLLLLSANEDQGGESA